MPLPTRSSSVTLRLSAILSVAGLAVASAAQASEDAGTSGAAKTAGTADATCQVLARGFVFFDLRKQEWIERDELKLSRCGDSLDLLLHDAKTLAKKDIAHPQSPSPGTEWQLAGLSCSRRGVKAGSRAVDLLVLSKPATEGVALRPIDAWTVNPKTSKLVQIPADQIVCSADEP